MSWKYCFPRRLGTEAYITRECSGYLRFTPRTVQAHPFLDDPRLSPCSGEGISSEPRIARHSLIFHPTPPDLSHTEHFTASHFLSHCPSDLSKVRRFLCIWTACISWFTSELYTLLHIPLSFGWISFWIYPILFFFFFFSCFFSYQLSA